jgi:hypothetical protein
MGSRYAVTVPETLPLDREEEPGSETSAVPEIEDLFAERTVVSLAADRAAGAHG